MSLFSSANKIKECPYCEQPVWFFQDKGKPIELTPDTIQLCHAVCQLENEDAKH